LRVWQHGDFFDFLLIAFFLEKKFFVHFDHVYASFWGYYYKKFFHSCRGKS
jgi:hypothetical protein